MDAIKLKIGYVVLKGGDPVKTGSGYIGRTAKLYKHAGRARVVAKAYDGMVCTAYIEVPGDD